MILKEGKTIVTSFDQSKDHLHSKNDTNCSTEIKITVLNNVMVSNPAKINNFDILLQAAEFNDESIDEKIVGMMRNQSFDLNSLVTEISEYLNTESNIYHYLPKLLRYICHSTTLLDVLFDKAYNPRSEETAQCILELANGKNLDGEIVMILCKAMLANIPSQKNRGKIIDIISRSNYLDDYSIGLFKHIGGYNSPPDYYMNFIMIQLISYSVDYETLHFDSILRVVDGLLLDPFGVDDGYMRPTKYIMNYLVEQNYKEALEVIFKKCNVLTAKTIALLRSEISSQDNTLKMNLLIHHEILQNNTQAMFAYSYLENFFEFITDHGKFLDLYETLRVLRTVSDVQSQIEGLIEFKLADILGKDILEKSVFNSCENEVNINGVKQKPSGNHWMVKKDFFEQRFEKNFDAGCTNPRVSISTDDVMKSYDSCILVL